MAVIGQRWEDLADDSFTVDFYGACRHLPGSEFGRFKGPIKEEIKVEVQRRAGPGAHAWLRRVSL